MASSPPPSSFPLCSAFRRAGGPWRWLAAALLIVPLAAVACAAPSTDRDGGEEPGRGTGTYTRNRDVEGERFMLEAGAELFSEHCAVCHGERMEGAAQGTPLVGAALAGGASVDELVASISNGVPERDMPAWSAIMSADQIKTLALWIAEVRDGLVYSQFNYMDERTIPEGAIRTQAYDLEIDVLIAGLDPLPYSLAVLPLSLIHI